MDVPVREARVRFSRLLKLVEDGESVTIVRRGVPVARLTAVPSATPWRLGWDTGAVPDSALQPMTAGEAEEFLGGR
jgi:prevent-host-death family protein